VVRPAVDAQACAVCLGPFDPFELVALLVDGWAHTSCADLVTMEPPC
jgi:hypothetical protein